VLSEKYKCVKYKCEFLGTFDEKRRCPIWAPAIAAEVYYDQKWEYEKDLMDKEVEEKRYRILNDGY
jgi:hypothetical protein